MAGAACRLNAMIQPRTAVDPLASHTVPVRGWNHLLGGKMWTCFKSWTDGKLYLIEAPEDVARQVMWSKFGINTERRCLHYGKPEGEFHVCTAVSIEGVLEYERTLGSIEQALGEFAVPDEQFTEDGDLLPVCKFLALPHVSVVMAFQVSDEDRRGYFIPPQGVYIGVY